MIAGINGLVDTFIYIALVASDAGCNGRTYYKER
jgi:hypothetical protein